jgi:O-succinylbenzoic acid--CoA ligase
VFSNNVEAPLKIQNGALWFKNLPGFKKFQQLTLNGSTYSGPELKTLSTNKLTQKELKSWERSLFHFLEEWLNDEDFVEINTSGSTGTPKTIRANKGAMLTSAFNTLGFFELKPGQSALLCLSCDYIAGKMMVVRALAGGLNLITVPVSGHPLETLKEPIDFAAMTPFQMSNELAKSAPGQQWLRKVILGGAPAGRDLIQKIQNEEFMVWETYGMTETLSHIALKRLNGPDASSWFTPLKNVALTTDDRGCLIVEAPGITACPLTTNDLIDLDANGRFRVKGRIDNIINTGGIKVSPEEVEEQIAHLMPGPYAVVAAHHETLGQQLVLITEQPLENPGNCSNR